MVGMGHRRRARSRYDGAHRRGPLVEKHGLSISALMLAALAGCHEVETRQVFFHVNNVKGCGQIADCSMMTLQCIRSVQAILTPENGNPVTGLCSPVSGTSATL